MRYLVCSDVHGGEKELCTVLDYLEQYHCDYLVLLGDLLAYGGYGSGIGLWNSSVPKVVSILNEFKDKIIAVRGNCDSDKNCSLFEFDCDQFFRDLFIYREISDNAKHFDVPVQRLLLTHGHYFSEDFSRCYKSQDSSFLSLSPLYKGDIVLSGHTHVAGIFAKENGLINVNPGSISLPRGGSKAGFALLLEDHLELRTLNNKLVDALDFNFHKRDE